MEKKPKVLNKFKQLNYNKKIIKNQIQNKGGKNMIKSFNRFIEGTATDKDYDNLSKLVIGLIIYVVVFGIILQKGKIKMREEFKELKKYINLIILGVAIVCLAIILKDIFWIGYSLILTLKMQGFTWFSLIVLILASIVFLIILNYFKTKLKAE